MRQDDDPDLTASDTSPSPTLSIHAPTLPRPRGTNRPRDPVATFFRRLLGHHQCLLKSSCANVMPCLANNERPVGRLENAKGGLIPVGLDGFVEATRSRWPARSEGWTAFPRQSLYCNMFHCKLLANAECSVGRKGIGHFSPTYQAYAQMPHFIAPSTCDQLESLTKQHIPHKHRFAVHGQSSAPALDSR